MLSSSSRQSLDLMNGTWYNKKCDMQSICVSTTPVKLNPLSGDMSFPEGQEGNSNQSANQSDGTGI